MNNNLIILFVAIVLIAVLVLIYNKYDGKKDESGLANPASVYCVEQGGIVEDVMFEAGVRGFCKFDDASSCGQWDFFRGDCDKGGLKIEILKNGEGALAETNDILVMHYTGTLEDGRKFDSSLDRGQPFSFTLGIGQVIKGWDQGVLGMRVGEKRRLTISPDLAYGEGGVPGAIPPNSVLIFEVELLEIK